MKPDWSVLMKGPPIGFQGALSQLFLAKNAVFMSANERSAQVTPKSIPVCGGSTLNSDQKIGGEI